MLARADQTGTSLTGQGAFAAVVTNSTGNLVKTGAARCVRILVVSGTGAIDVYDGTTAGGTHLYSKASTVVGDIYVLDLPCATGLFVQPAAATTVTVVWV